MSWAMARIARTHHRRAWFGWSRVGAGCTSTAARSRCPAGAEVGGAAVIVTVVPFFRRLRELGPFQTAGLLS